MTEYTITDLLNNFIEDSENIDNNLRLAIYYHCIGQTASAVSYYLRTAERSEDDKVKYECLLGAAMCFEQQGTRNFTVKSLLQNALTVSANRPEAYYLLSKFYRKEGNHYDAYLLASIGERVAEKNPEPLDFYIGYPGFYSIMLEKAESAYPCGLCDESRSLFFRLKDEYISDMTEEDKKYLQDKLSSLGAHGPSYQFRTYEKKDHSELRYKFKGSENIQNNHSQVFQDIFILSMLDGKRDGTFLEVGGGFAYHKNNTALLERDFGWKGVSIEFNETCVNDYKTYRPNTNVLHANALLINYSRLIKEYFGDEKVLDYLQLDIEPSANTYEALLSMPFDEYKFRVITYEHDHYVDVSGSYRDKSREYLTKMGYELVVSNVAEDDESSFEDWWVHPDLIDSSILNVMKATDDSVKNAGKYMLCGEVFLQETPKEDEINEEWEWQWGEIGQLEWFKHSDNSAEPEKFWDMTPWPTMEFTTSVPKKGCVVDCVYCPQRILEKSYVDEERYLTLDNFKRAVDKLPQNVRVTFAGFTEPWLNKDCTDMVLYAQERGHPIAVFTTGIGMKVDDVYRIKNVPYDLGPNGRFVLHLPDNERRAKHPITKNYIEVLEAFKHVHHEIQGFYTMAMGTVHDEVKHFFPEAVVPAFWSRAGNLVGEAMLKPELLNLQSEYKSIYHGEEPRTCGCDEHLYHNIMLPNGDVSLCCMDYNLKFIIGNLFEQSYGDIAPKPQSCYDMCRFCENGVKPV